MLFSGHRAQAVQDQKLQVFGKQNHMEATRIEVFKALALGIFFLLDYYKAE